MFTVLEIPCACGSTIAVKQRPDRDSMLYFTHLGLIFSIADARSMPDETMLIDTTVRILTRMSESLSSASDYTRRGCGVKWAV